MTTFALLPIFSGFEYDAVKNFVGFTPIEKGYFKCLWSLEEGWGDFEQTDGASRIILSDGSLTLTSVKLGNLDKVSRVIADGTAVDFVQNGDTVSFDKITVKEKIEFIA